MKKLLLPFILAIWSQALYGQDTLKVLAVEDLFAMILENHPVAKQANLLNERARQELRMTRGLLDPSINSKLNHKEFQSKEYFTLWDSYLRVPTWLGVDLKAGYERNNGTFLNPENKTPAQGLTYAGISVPLGQGLFIDERRSQIRQAQQFPAIAQAEQLKIINKLLLQASKDYWDWMFYYNKWKLYNEAVGLATVRFNATTERVVQGDMAAIDTVEAQMQVQNFRILLTQAEVEYKNSSLILSNYLWSTEGVPLEITSKTVPPASGLPITMLPNDSIAALINRARVQHPDIVKLRAKLAQQNIERRFIADKFKPKLTLDFNLLQSDFGFQSDALSSSYFNNNYKFGASFAQPLFLRTERGKFQMTKLKIQETNLELQQTSREISNSIQASANELAGLQSQLQVQEGLVKNSEALRAGEQSRFESGESSIFLINSRECTLISNKIKLFELKAKYAKSLVLVRWASGKI